MAGQSIARQGKEDRVIGETPATHWSIEMYEITGNTMKPRGDAQVIRNGLIYMQELASDKPEPSAKQL